VIIDRKMLDWGDVNINDIGREWYYEYKY
jgi:hypothetical protein